MTLGSFAAVSTMAVAPAASASASASWEEYLLGPGGSHGRCFKGNKARETVVSIPRRTWDVKIAKIDKTEGRKDIYFRERAFNKAVKFEQCVKAGSSSTGPYVYKWRVSYYGHPSGKVSRINRNTQMCHNLSCTGGSFNNGTWRSGWTHFKM
ncbi:hypothetical protein ABZ297_46760 [Nonomuraea sp. NPDC005983]|uniref:hypothetical protein n=1 Tax=Nonomuraea sp. NPDC005983 TaxID=3155595 RepID=UPI0033A98699